MLILSRINAPTEGVRLEQNTELFVNGKSQGVGKLYIAESRVTWISREGQGMSFEYPDISLHAVSRDLSAFGHENLYLMIDKDLREGGNNSSSGEEDDSTGKISEIRFVPDDKTQLDAMFKAMSSCQALHPDPQDSMSDYDETEEEDGEEYGYDEEGPELTPQGQAQLQRLEDMLGAGTEGPLEPGDEPQIGARALDSEKAQNGEPMDTDQFQDAD